MINLKANQASEQLIVVTAQDIIERSGSEYYTLTFLASMGQADYTLTPRIVQDNTRFTQLGVFTNEDDPTNGKILLTERGEWVYELYLTDGVDSELIERGSMWVEIGNDNEFYEQSKENTVYYKR